MLIGLAGFALTGFAHFIGESPMPDKLLWFQINPLQNVVHVLIGIGLLLGAAGGETASRVIVGFVSTVLVIVGIAGFLVIDTEFNWLSLNIADNFLHLGTAILGFAAFASSRREAATY